MWRYPTCPCYRPGTSLSSHALSWAYFQLLQPQQKGLKILGCLHLAQTQSAGQWGPDLVHGPSADKVELQPPLWPELAELQRGGREKSRGATLWAPRPAPQLRDPVASLRRWNRSRKGISTVSSEVIGDLTSLLAFG